MQSMGLAAPRRKSKYDIDPRNNAWANDDSKFGQKLMEKFGWEKGKGLGALEDGETQNVKVKVKNDKQGIGSNNDYSDNWLDNQDDFNSLLAALNSSHSAPGSGTATPIDECSTGTLGSMEERSKSSKSRVHYKKFAQSKDLNRANLEDLDSLFGRRKKFEKRSKKAKGVQSAPLTPLGGTSPVREGVGEETGDAATKSVPPPDSTPDKEFDVDGNLRTVTSTLSVSDYFAKKMAEMKAKRNGVSTAAEQFCENSRRRFEELKEEEEEKAKGEERGMEKRVDEEVDDKPEIYAQEKFQKSSISVQEYFEMKMKEKKAKAANSANVIILGEEEDVEEKEDEEKEDDEKKLKKKKKKKNEIKKPNEDVVVGVKKNEEEVRQSVVAVEHEKPLKKKKKKKKNAEGVEETKKFTMSDDDPKPKLVDEPQKLKKKKKRKKESELAPEMSIIPEEPPRKKKKKTIISQQTEDVDDSLNNHIEKTPSKKKKKKKTKTDVCALISPFP